MGQQRSVPDWRGGRHTTRALRDARSRVTRPAALTGGRPHPLSSRRLLGIACTALAFAIAVPAVAQARSQQRAQVAGLVPQLTASQFADRGPEISPWVRWTIAPNSSTTELQEVVPSLVEL
jgi:hypothetical protein